MLAPAVADDLALGVHGSLGPATAVSAPRDSRVLGTGTALARAGDEDPAPADSLATRSERAPLALVTGLLLSALGAALARGGDGVRERGAVLALAARATAVCPPLLLPREVGRGGEEVGEVGAWAAASAAAAEDARSWAT